MKQKITGVKHFKSKADYGNWLAYGHIHGEFKVPGVQKIFIKGKAHKVLYSKRK